MNERVRALLVFGAPLLALVSGAAGCGRIAFDLTSIDGSADGPGIEAGAADSSRDGSAQCVLTDSGPIVASADGQLIENLRITAAGAHGIEVAGFTDVTIRNCEILHAGAHGIHFEGADRIRIEDTRVIHTGAPPSGPHADSPTNRNIDGNGSTDVVISRVRVERGSTGIWLNTIANAQLSFIEAFDMRGGRGVWFSASDGAVLENFSVVNPLDTSWPSGGVQVTNGSDCQIRRGVIDGDSDPSGGGVRINHPGNGSGGLVEDVDAVHIVNVCFNAFGADGVTFRRTRCRAMLCGDPVGRGPAASDGLGWSGGGSIGGHALEAGEYFDLCRDLVVFPQDDFSPLEATESDFTPRPPLALDFCWESTAQ